MKNVNRFVGNVNTGLRFFFSESFSSKLLPMFCKMKHLLGIWATSTSNMIQWKVIAVIFSFLIIHTSQGNYPKRRRLTLVIKELINLALSFSAFKATSIDVNAGIFFHPAGKAIHVFELSWADANEPWMRQREKVSVTTRKKSYTFRWLPSLWLVL